MADDLKQRLRDADQNSAQRILGSRIFAEAADRIEALEAENATLTAEKAAEVAHADRLAVQGKRFHGACASAWAAGEPAHKVKLMMDDADEFAESLAAHDARRDG